MDSAVGKDDPFQLCRPVEVFAISGYTQVAVYYIGLDIGILILEIHRLLDADVTTIAGTVGQMTLLVRALTGALYKYHTLDRLAVRRPRDRFTISGAGQGLKFGLIYHIGSLTITELGQLIGIIAGEAAGLNDGANIFSTG